MTEVELVFERIVDIPKFIETHGENTLHIELVGVPSVQEELYFYDDESDMEIAFRVIRIEHIVHRLYGGALKSHVNVMIRRI